ncbi:MAG: amino acid permease [Planctomycetota bacterium]|nr:amino acid permease [Planctomycetota bacterium]
MSTGSLLARIFRKKSVEELHQESTDRETAGTSLVKSLNLLDLTCFGIAAVVGAGIFTTLGKAAADGGPAVSILFVLTAITCLFSALCYSEFASRIPVSGSAYTYSYAVFGELIAWLIGWNLLMEYAIGNSTIAFSWSDYFSNILNGIGCPLPGWLETDYYSCSEEAGKAADTLKNPTFKADLVAIWENAPRLGGMRIILDLPALAINLVITCLVYIGIQESKLASNTMVFLKLGVVLGVIVIGAFYVNPSNWIPFAPNGATGVLQGIAAVFFTYIGFDAISTTAEECKNPKRDLPLATLLTLGICTVLYVILAFVLTGMVNYKELDVDDPLAIVFSKHNLNWLSGIISMSAVIAVASVFLVFQLGQPRIFMSMARDGLLPKQFAKIHPRFKTPAFSTIVTGIAVAIPTLFLNSQIVLDLCSIGTLFAFVLVCGGILELNAIDRNETAKSGNAVVRSGFKVPYINGQFVMPVLFLLYSAFMRSLPDNHDLTHNWSWEKFPYFVFWAVFLALSILTSIRKWSLIPVLGVITNLYLIAGIGHLNWLRFGVWCLVGLAVYFVYGYRNSRLANR